MDRHFTATGFVVQGDKVLLLWHRKAQMWLPPGGHLLPGEDPVAGVLREVREETGLVAEVVSSGQPLSFTYPQQLPAPFTILVENSFEPGTAHQHIDFIYFCRPVDSRGGSPTAPTPPLAAVETTVVWADAAALHANQPLELAVCGPSAGSGQALTALVPPDVRELARRAIDLVR